MKILFLSSGFAILPGSCLKLYFINTNNNKYWNHIVTVGHNRVIQLVPKSVDSFFYVCIFYAFYLPMW